MQRMLGICVIFTWLILLVGGPFRPKPNAPTTALRPAVGYHSPKVIGRDAQGRIVTISEFKGKAVFLNFWASWCGPCRMEMPEIQRLADRLPADTAIVAVNMTGQETSTESAQAFLHQRGFTFPSLLDPTGEFEQAFQVISLPTSLFISPDGVVTARINGPITYGAMTDYLKAARR